LLTLAFPAQSVIAQRGPTAGTGIFQTHIFRLLSDDRKTPCDTLPLGQADAGHEEAALKEPHPPADVVSSTTKIFFSYLKAANCCPIYLFIAAPFVLSVVLYLIISQHPLQ